VYAPPPKRSQRKRRVIVLPFASGSRYDRCSEKGNAVAEEVHLIFVPSPTAREDSMMRFAEHGVRSPVYAAGDDDVDDGGTIGMNIIEQMKATGYLDKLDRDDPVTLAVPHLTPENVARAREIGADLERHVVIVDVTGLS
jgi:hypothetical protein